MNQVRDTLELLDEETSQSDVLIGVWGASNRLATLAVLEAMQEVGWIVERTFPKLHGNEGETVQKWAITDAGRAQFDTMCGAANR